MLFNDKSTGGFLEYGSDEFWYGEQPSKEEIKDGGSSAKKQSTLNGNVDLFGWYITKYLFECFAHIL